MSRFRIEEGTFPYQIIYRPPVENQTIWAKTAEEAQSLFEQDEDFEFCEIESVEGGSFRLEPSPDEDK